MSGDALDHLVGAGEAFWRASWQAAVLAALVAVLQLALGGRIAPRWRHAMWLLVLVRLALPVVPSSPLSVFNLAPRPTEIDSASGPVDVTPTETFVSALPPALAAAPPDAPVAPSAGLWQGWPQALAAIWLAGGLLLTGRIAWATWRVTRVIRRLQHVNDGAVVEILRATAAELRVRRLPTLLTGDGLFSPALVGVIRPKLLVPRELLDRFQPAELRLVLLHELAHLKRRDVAVNWVASLLCVLHWPNPVAWLAAWRLRLERELATDELVLAHTASDVDRRAYGHTIVKLLETFARAARPVPAAAVGAVGILEGKQQMKRRITMIARFAKQSRAWTALAAVIVIALGAVALTDAVGAEPDATQPKEADRRSHGEAFHIYDRTALRRRPETVDENYRIKHNDVVELKVPDPANPTGEPIRHMIIITDSGKIVLPQLKASLQAAGLTSAQLKESVAEAYRKATGLQDADVDVVVTPVTRPGGAIAVGDLVSVSVFELAGPGVESVKTSRIDDAGTISLPYVGEIKAAGLRPAELERAIAKAYEDKKVLHAAVVAVSMPERGESHRLAAKVQPDEGQGQPPAAKAAEVDPAIRAMLDRQLPEVNFDGVAFSDVIDFLRDVTAMNIAVDWRGLEAAGIDRNSPVTLRVKNVAFENVLKILLHDLSPDLRQDFEGNVLRITAAPPVAARPGKAPAATPPGKGAKVEIRAYDVSDLVTPKDDQSAAATNTDAVTMAIANVADPSARVSVVGNKVVVATTAESHRNVADMLDLLRANPSAAPTTRSAAKPSPATPGK